MYLDTVNGSRFPRVSRYRITQRPITAANRITPTSSYTLLLGHHALEPAQCLPCLSEQHTVRVASSKPIASVPLRNLYAVCQFSGQLTYENPLASVGLAQARPNYAWLVQLYM